MVVALAENLIHKKVVAMSDIPKKVIANNSMAEILNKVVALAEIILKKVIVLAEILLKRGRSL